MEMDDFSNPGMVFVDKALTFGIKLTGPTENPARHVMMTSKA